MNRVHAIERLGFQRWYERELLRSHANLVLLLLCTIGLLASAEVYESTASWADQWQVIAGAGACVAIGVVALRRYLYRLNHAEFVADQAVCKGCETYARLEVLGGTAASRILPVRCRHCDKRWSLQL